MAKTAIKTNKVAREDFEALKKGTLLEGLKDEATKLQNVATEDAKNLFERVSYTITKASKSLAQVKKSDLIDVLMEALEFKYPAKVENSIKPKKKASSKTLTPIKEVEPKDTEDEELPKKDKKSSKSSKVSKKSAPKKDPEQVETIPDPLTKDALPLAKVFPKKVHYEGLGTLVACPSKYHTLDELREAWNDKDHAEIIFMGYWTQRHIKEFSYGATRMVSVPKKGFQHDLDAMMCLYVCDDVDRLWAVSTTTEALFQFEGMDLEPVECTAPDGTKFNMRYSAGLEFEIYELEKEESEEDEEESEE